MLAYILTNLQFWTLSHCYPKKVYFIKLLLSATENGKIYSNIFNNWKVIFIILHD
jgi:hypothetical protein